MAIEAYKNAIRLCPPGEKVELAIFHNNLGIAFNKDEQALAAKGEFTKSIEMNPEYPKPRWHRMLIYKNETEYERAIEDAKKILEIDPNFNNS